MNDVTRVFGPFQPLNNVASNLRLIWLLAISAFAPVTAEAQGEDLREFSLSLAAYFTDRDTETRLDTDTDFGTKIDLEDVLGMDNTNTDFRVDGYFRFNALHRIDFSWYDLPRSGRRRINATIDYGDLTFPIDTTVVSDGDWSALKLAYGYSFWHRGDDYLAFTAGLYVIDSRMDLADENSELSEAGEVTAPLPVIGLRGSRALDDRWSIRGSAELFAIEFDNVDGHLFDLSVMLDYAVRENISIGVGLNAVDVDVSIKQTKFSGSLDVDYLGALAYIKFDF